MLMQPTFDGQFVGVSGIGVIQGKIIRQVAIHADMPSVTGSLRVVEYQTTCSPLSASLLKLIDPSSVIGHVSSPEQLTVVVAWIVHHRDDDLPLHVNPFIVVPSIFGSMNAKTTEHVFCLSQVNLFRSTGCPHHCIVGIAQLSLSAAFYRELIAHWLSSNRNQVERLKPTPVKGRLQTHFFQLSGKVVHRLVFIGRHGLASAKLI